VRRNALSDFTNVMRNGKIAMKLPEGVAPGQRAHLLRGRRRDAGHRARAGRSASHHRCARLQGPRFHRRARHPAGRGDEVVSMSSSAISRPPEERAAYLKMRRLMAG
jgi:DNA gyrase subunit A